MSTDAIGAYSNDSVSGKLPTPPFVYKVKSSSSYFAPVHINGHTPDEKFDDEAVKTAVTLNDFRQNIATDKLFHIQDFESTEVIGLKSDAVEQGLINSINSEFPIGVKSDYPIANVSGFQASALSQTDIVKGAIQRGYSPTQATTMARAQKAYLSNMGNINTNVVTTLSGYNINAALQHNSSLKFI